MEAQPITISFVGDTAIKAQLEALAKAQAGRSVSSLIRSILEDHLALAVGPVERIDPRQLPLVVEGVEDNKLAKYLADAIRVNPELAPRLGVDYEPR